jgi:transcriptional regulator with GAF, ATPase, and Fis domain
MAAALVRQGWNLAEIARQWGLTDRAVAYRVERFEAMRAAHGS